MTINDRISKARISMILDMPFFGALAFKLGTVIDNSIPTACTDGKVIRFNEEYVASLSNPELTGLLVEEIGHCAFGHIWRMENRDHERWNVACDQVLWRMIAQLGEKSSLCKLSADCPINPRFDGLSAEEIYHLLPKQKDSPRPTPSRGEMAPASADPEQAEELKTDWETAVQGIATAERMKGKGQMPAWMEELVHASMTPKIPWTDTLRDFARIAAKDDYSTSRPNRRYLHSGFILPSLYSEKLGTIVVAIDTSGSINMDILQEMLAELQSILDSSRPQSITLIDCDSRINQTREFTPGDNLAEFRVKGGGGTNFRPVFEHVAEKQIDPACLIYLTDLDGSFPKEEPPYPSLWINYGHPKQVAPFGQTINVA
jgi:predicted metal-dependent peptidase